MLAGQFAHVTAALFTGSAVYIFYGLRCNSLALAPRSISFYERPSRQGDFNRHVIRRLVLAAPFLSDRHFSQPVRRPR